MSELRAFLNSDLVLFSNFLIGIGNAIALYSNWMFGKNKKEFYKQIDKEREIAMAEREKVCKNCKSAYAIAIKALKAPA
jgi:hypothetical protein